MHRAYHAVQTPMTAKDGTPTNAVFGFLTMLCKFIEMASPDAVVCAFDAGKPVHRIEAMAQYKAQRPPMDEELHVQFPVIQELLESMAIPRGEGARLGGRRPFWAPLPPAMRRWDTRPCSSPATRTPTSWRAS